MTLKIRHEREIASMEMWPSHRMKRIHWMERITDDIILQ